MAFIPQAKILEDIRQQIADAIGTEVDISENFGRARFNNCSGKIVDVYPKMFLVEIPHRRHRCTTQSYQYVDIMTGKVSVLKDNEPLVQLNQDKYKTDTPTITGAKTQLECATTKPIKAQIKTDNEKIFSMVNDFKNNNKASILKTMKPVSAKNDNCLSKSAR